MKTARSSDGTTIAYDITGRGPRLILVDGALCSRQLGPGKGLARVLAERFTVINYDRRGRGDSGDAPDYAVEREIEDLEALIATADDDVFVFGQSSGAVLALHAASRLSQITRLAVYEAPLIVDDTRSPTGPEYHQQLTELLAQGKRGPAVRLFLELVGLPPVMIAAIRLTPIWPKLKTLAKTLPYDSQITAEHQQGRALSREQWATARQPALVLSGGKSDAWMLNGMQALAESLPQATYRVLEGQTHNLRPKIVAPELVRFARDTSGPQRREPQGLG